MSRFEERVLDRFQPFLFKNLPPWRWRVRKLELKFALTEWTARFAVNLLERVEPEWATLKGPIEDVRDQVESALYELTDEVLSDCFNTSLADLPLNQRLAIDHRVYQMLRDLGVGYEPHYAADRIPPLAVIPSKKD